MNGSQSNLDEGIAALALIGLRALAEYDPAEYARVTDASKSDLDERIQSLLERLGRSQDDKRLDHEIREKYLQLVTIAKESRGRTELVFLLRQLHMSSLERAQQLSLRFARTPRATQETSSSAPVRMASLSRKDSEPRSTEDDFLRLAVGRLLRALPGYSPLFEVATSDRAVDCVLTSGDDRPPVVIEVKLRLRRADLQRVLNQVKRAAGAWGKGSLGVVICPSGQLTRHEQSPTKVQPVYILEFDVESNSFVGPGERLLVERLSNHSEL